MKFIGKTVLGGIVVYATVAVLSGGIDNANNLFIISSICTAGVGLVFWILLSMGVGLISFEILKLAYYRLTGRKPSRDFSANQSTDERAIRAYITVAEQNHIQKEEIIHSLKQKGWPDDIILQSFQK